MKLPRWLVIAMLSTSVLSVLAAVGWWWVTWPERTARIFVELLASEKTDEAQAMMLQRVDSETVKDVWGDWIKVPAPKNWNEFDPLPRSLQDLLTCTRQYDYRIHLHESVRFTVQRGTIEMPWQVVLWVDSRILDNGEEQWSERKAQRIDPSFWPEIK